MKKYLLVISTVLFASAPAFALNGDHEGGESAENGWNPDASEPTPSPGPSLKEKISYEVAFKRDLKIPADTQALYVQDGKLVKSLGTTQRGCMIILKNTVQKTFKAGRKFKLVNSEAQPTQTQVSCTSDDSGCNEDGWKRVYTVYSTLQVNPQDLSIQMLVCNHGSALGSSQAVMDARKTLTPAEVQEIFGGLATMSRK